jgi:hypothetical protein
MNALKYSGFRRLQGGFISLEILFQTDSYYEIFIFGPLFIMTYLCASN